MDLPSQMALFADVVKHGSFSATARAVGHTPSAVSRQIALLEDRLGLRLLTRAAGGVTLTEDGRAVHERCADLAADVAAVQAMAAASGETPRGRLRVACTPAFGKAQLLPRLGAFLDAYPQVQVSLTLTDRAINLAEDGHEIGVRFTEQVEDETLITRRLAPNARVLCAAPSYLARRPAPQKAADLRDHDCLTLSTVSDWNDWGLTDEAGATVTPQGRLDLNSAAAVHTAALEGLGLARLSNYLIGDDLAAGRLVRVLPDYVQNDSDIVAVFRSRRNLSLRARAFIDWLAECMTPPPWEAAPGARRQGPRKTD